MKRFFAISLLVALFVLLVSPSSAFARTTPRTPRLDLKTTNVELYIVLPGTTTLLPSYVTAPVAFMNSGGAMLEWRAYIGSDFAGCAVQSESNWLGLGETSGMLKPGAFGQFEVKVDTAVLTPGTHEGLLCMVTNDKAHELVVIPVAAHVK